MRDKIRYQLNESTFNKISVVDPDSVKSEALNRIFYTGTVLNILLYVDLDQSQDAVDPKDAMR
jgi:hypothetical protein